MVHFLRKTGCDARSWEACEHRGLGRAVDATLKIGALLGQVCALE